MNKISFSYHGDSRNLKKTITCILKSQCATKIQKINYCQTFELKDKNIQKSETKILIIYTENKENLLNFIQKIPELEIIADLQ